MGGDAGNGVFPLGKGCIDNGQKRVRSFIKGQGWRNICYCNFSNCSDDTCVWSDSALPFLHPLSIIVIIIISKQQQQQQRLTYETCYEGVRAAVWRWSSLWHTSLTSTIYMYAYLHPISVVSLCRPGRAVPSGTLRCVNGGAQSTSDIG